MARGRVDPDRVVIGDLTATPMRERGERADGRRYWRIRRAGTRETVATGWWTRDEAEAAVELVRRAPTTSPRSAPGAVRTVGDLLRAWTEVQRQRLAGGEIAQRSYENYRNVARHWLGAVGDVLARQLTRELVEDTIRSWRASGFSPRSCHQAAAVLGAVVSWGAPRGHCPAISLRKLAAAEVGRDERVNCDYTPTRTEADAVLATIRAGRDRHVVELLGLTGARIGEVGALQVGSWDRARGELVISGRDPSRARRGKVRARRWPVVGRLEVLLGELAGDRAPDAPLIEGLPADCSRLARDVLAEACDAAGVQRYTPHGLRRLVAMELLDITDPRTVAELTGHSVQILLADYVRPRPERMRDVVARAHQRRGAVVPLRAQTRGTATGERGED